MANSSNELLNEIQKLKKKEITITKKKLKDIDVIEMQLSDAFIHDRNETIDGYVSPHTIQLFGAGKVQTDDEAEPIPYFTFEIPLSNDIQSTVYPSGILIQSDGCEYKISVTQ